MALYVTPTIVTYACWAFLKTLRGEGSIEGNRNSLKKIGTPCKPNRGLSYQGGSLMNFTITIGHLNLHQTKHCYNVLCTRVYGLLDRDRDSYALNQFIPSDSTDFMRVIHDTIFIQHICSMSDQLGTESHAIPSIVMQVWVGALATMLLGMISLETKYTTINISNRILTWWCHYKKVF